MFASKSDALGQLSREHEATRAQLQEALRTVHEQSQAFGRLVLKRLLRRALTDVKVDWLLYTPCAEAEKAALIQDRADALASAQSAFAAKAAQLKAVHDAEQAALRQELATAVSRAVTAEDDAAAAKFDRDAAVANANAVWESKMAETARGYKLQLDEKDRAIAALENQCKEVDRGVVDKVGAYRRELESQLSLVRESHARE